MPRLTTHPAPARVTNPEPAPGLLSSPLIVRVHLAVTALLMAALLTVLVLAGVGLLRLGHPTVAVAEQASESEKPKSEEVVGRYQIESSADSRQVLLEAGKLNGVLDARVREAWVFHYKGGFLQCALETESGGEATVASTLPNEKEWGRFLVEQKIGAEDAHSLNKEGRLILMGLVTSVSIEQALQPLHPHLGAVFTQGPAGPLHPLVPYFLDVERYVEYRMFLSAGPPKDTKGPGFNLWSTPWLPIRSHFVDEVTTERAPQVVNSKNVEAGKELTLLQRPLGKSTIRLKARFLTDAEVIEKVSAERD